METNTKVYEITWLKNSNNASEVVQIATYKEIFWIYKKENAV